MACRDVTLILASASLAMSLAPAPGRSSPSTRKHVLGPRTFSLAFLAAVLKAAGFDGTKSSWARRLSGKPEKASRFTFTSRSDASALAPLPALLEVFILKYCAVQTVSAMSHLHTELARPGALKILGDGIEPYVNAFPPFLEIPLSPPGRWHLPVQCSAE